MLIQELLIQITGLLENINANMESIGEVVNNLGVDSPLADNSGDQWVFDSWSVKKGGWKAGDGWHSPGAEWGGG